MKTENNKLLAEFLGWEKFETFEGSEEYCLTYVEELHLKVGDFNIYSLSELKFNSDWNWLMLVVDKIENDYPMSVIISCSNCEVYNCETQETIFHLEGVKIEATYNACVEFVKFYNDGKR